MTSKIRNGATSTGTIAGTCYYLSLFKERRGSNIAVGQEQCEAAMDRRIIVFLDIDGVLLPFPPDPSLHIPNGRIFPNETLAALTCILEAFPSREVSSTNTTCASAVNNPITEVDIVLSSTWRVQKSIRNDIIADFHSYGVGPLATFDDDFYDITDPSLHTERQHEIYEWLQRYREKMTATTTRRNHVLAWVVLDDEELLRGPTNERLQSMFQGHVVHCDSKRGVTGAQAVEAIQLLRRQLNDAMSVTT